MQRLENENESLRVSVWRKGGGRRGGGGEGGRKGREVGKGERGGGVGKGCMLKNVCGEGIDIRLFSVLML